MEPTVITTVRFRGIGYTADDRAAMVDTFKPLMVTEEAMKVADPLYYKTWVD